MISMAYRTRVPSMALSVGVALAATAAPLAPPEARKARVDPIVVSVHPFVGRRGTTFVTTVRGNGLQGTTSIFAPNAPLTATIVGIDPEPLAQPEPPAETRGKRKAPFDLVRLRVAVARDARPGRYPLRLVTAQGTTNPVPLYVTEYPVIREPDGSHETADTAITVTTPPAVFTGRLARRGETDYYAVEAKAGEVLTFEAVGAAGGNAQGFDPSLSIFEPSGSWFDPKRLNRIAWNDEPVWVTGGATDAALVYRFARTGRYFVRIEAFSGRGGPDYSYELRILPGEAARPAAQPADGWDERSYSRSLSAGRLNELAARGGRPENQKPIDTYRAGTFDLPGIVEGTLARPGETQRARFRLDAPTDIAIEVETPAAAPPLFNPVVRLLDPAGSEAATNLLAGRSLCTGALTKSLEVKTIIPLRDTGEYRLEIRDMTSEVAGADFRYRILVRPQIPHVGNVRIDEDRINLAPGEAKTVRVAFDREEDFRGAIAVSAESLPHGVEALAGADYEPEPDRPPSTGRRERYTPRTERVVVVFNASKDAAPTETPFVVRLAVRSVVDGRPGAVLTTREIPLMVIGEP